MNRDKNLVDMFNDASLLYRDKTAFISHDTKFTFNDIYSSVRLFAGALEKLGVSSGDRVAIMLPNLIQYPIALFATLYLGAIVVNINPLYTASEVEYLIKDSTPKVVIILDLFAEKLNTFAHKYGVEHVIYTKIADFYNPIKKLIIGLAIKYIYKMPVNIQYIALHLSKLMQSSKAINKTVNINSEQPAFIQYTGATTGHPKGAVLSHNNIVANVSQVYEFIKPQVSNIENQIVICALPLYHIFSLTANLFVFFFYGSNNVLISNPKDIKDLAKVMKKVKFTVFNALDTLYAKLLQYKLVSKYECFKYSICGGMATRESVANEWHNVTGVYPTNCYGLSETSPAVTMNFLNEKFSKSVGYPLPFTEIEIRDDGGKKLSTNETGVIHVRGPQVMSRYWNNPKQTSIALVDKWLNTGDIGYINEKNQLFLVDRKNDMMVVSGFNVYPAEIELVIGAIHGVEEVAVVGQKLDGLDIIHAFIVLNDVSTSINIDMIKNHCRKHLAAYKIPKQIHFVNELPKTIIGKIDKKLIKNNNNYFNRPIP